MEKWFGLCLGVQSQISRGWKGGGSRTCKKRVDDSYHTDGRLSKGVGPWLQRWKVRHQNAPADLTDGL